MICVFLSSFVLFFFTTGWKCNYQCNIWIHKLYIKMGIIIISNYVKMCPISNAINNLQWYVSFHHDLYNFYSPLDKKEFVLVWLFKWSYLKIGIIIFINNYADKLFIIIMRIDLMFQKFCGICISYVLWWLSFSCICG